MTSRPVPDHGTYARASGSRGYRDPCPCELCRAERRRANKRFRVNRERGITSFVDPTEARQHLKLLHQTMAWDDLESATGLPLSTLNLLYAGRRTKIRRETHDKILATRANPSRAQLIDVTGSMRRVQALLYVGHSLRVIARECGASRNRIHSISNGAQPTIRREFAERIAEAYKRLAFRPPARDRFTTRTRNAAKARRWNGPLAWDDDIDDPEAQPEAGKRREGGPGRREKVDALEVARLTAAGKSAEQIAQELRCHKRTVVRARGRAQSEMTAAA
ncbi:hypothetical protein [Streptomyces sp. NPDC057557]|uniref:hypothetical protein n=1 Tax=Streptomyces sp. NPDC057557 TaxID=3346167 RepID=UPI0036CC9C70